MEERNTQPVWVTGYGIVSALGIGVQATLEALHAKRTGVGRLHYLQTAHNDLPCGEVPLSEAQMREMLGIPTAQITTRTALMGALALRQALESARWAQADNTLRNAFVNGTTVGGMDKSEQYYTDFLNNDTRNAYIKTHDCGACTQMIAAQGGGRFDCMTTLSTACSSAANAILLGVNLLRTGRAQRVIAGGSECLTRFHLNGFQSLKILDAAPCRPFDATRAGLNLGEGAAYLVLEPASVAAAREVEPLCVLSGSGNACDAFHQTASSPDGEGAFLAMCRALQDSGLDSGQIDYVNAHGTGTPNNDESEGRALMRVFGPHGVPPTSSTKAYTGHTTSASGAVEAVISILALQHRFLPVNLHFARPMDSLSFTPVTCEQPARPLRHVLTNSFGFGGNDTSLIFSLE